MRRFFTRRWAAGLALAAGVLAGQPAGASLLGLPFSLPAIGVGFAGESGATEFDAATGVLSVLADPTAIQLDPLDAPSLITPNGGIERLALSVVVDALGNLVGGVGGDDLVLQGRTTLFGFGTFSGVLLTAEVLDFGFQNGPGATTDYFDFRFRVTGGLLSFLFAGADAYVLLTSEASNFGGGFGGDFAGGARGNVKLTTVIPEPASALLIAAGLAGLACAGRRRV
jgi:hypothetical protein